MIELSGKKVNEMVSNDILLYLQIDVYLDDYHWRGFFQ